MDTATRLPLDENTLSEPAVSVNPTRLCHDPDMAECVHCGRDLYRHGNTTGNTLDGYTTTSNLCKECNRAELTRRGLGNVAAKDARDDRIVDWFWRLVGWGLALLVLFGVLGAIFGR
jgi:hypothetical protein